MPQHPPSAKLLKKRFNRERSRTLKPIFVDHREYDYAETILRISIGSQRDFDDFIHFLAQTARYERRDHRVRWGEPWVETEGAYDELMAGDYIPMLANDFQRFIKIREDTAEFLSRGCEKLPLPLPSILSEGNFLDGYIIEFDGQYEFDIVARIEDVYIRFELRDLA